VRVCLYVCVCLSIVSLCRCVSVSLCLCVSVSLCLCAPVSLCLCVSVSLCLCVCVSLFCCATVPLRVCLSLFRFCCRFRCRRLHEFIMCVLSLACSFSRSLARSLALLLSRSLARLLALRLSLSLAFSLSLPSALLPSFPFFVSIQNLKHNIQNIKHMGWRRLVGSIKLKVSCAKEPYKRDDILQKRPIILSILLTVATP